MRSMIVLGAFLTLSLGLVMGAEHRGTLVKVDGDKITFKKRVKKGDAGEEVTLPAAASIKVVKSKFNKDTKKVEAGEALEGGLKNEAVKAGAFVTLVTDADDKTVTELRVAPAFGKKKKE